MGWNKEKLVFLVSVVIAVLVIASTIPAWRGGGVVLTLTKPSPAGSVPMGPVRVNWFERKSEPTERDPFSKVSTWKVAVADPIPDPPIGELWRRLPLPQPLANAERARPPREAQAPEVEGQ